MATTRRVICPECKGFGYTRATAPDIRKMKKDGKEILAYVVDTSLAFWRPRLGSGCPRCLGVGHV